MHIFYSLNFSRVLLFPPKTRKKYVQKLNRIFTIKSHVITLGVHCYKCNVITVYFKHVLLMQPETKPVPPRHSRHQGETRRTPHMLGRKVSMQI